MDNYFRLYGLPESFHPDAAAVRKKYYELSRLYHPDRFAHAGEAQRSEILRHSAMNNEAYKTLTNSIQTMAYILKLHGLLEDEEKYKLPAEFLMEMMELNEAVSDYESDPSNESLAGQSKEALQRHLSQWEQEVEPLKAQFDHGDHSGSLLKRIKDYYFRHKYLLRIKERMDTFDGS